MSRDDEWGPGERAATEKAFDVTTVGEGERREVVELVFGEHPHSRQDNNIYARWPDGRIEGFDGHRVLVDVQITSYNYLKSSGLSGNEVRKGGTAKISFNGRVVHSFFFRDAQRALLDAHALIDKLMEHPLNLWREGTSAVGRRIWYDGQPAVIRSVYRDSGELYVVPDGIERFDCPRDWMVSPDLRGAWPDYAHGLRLDVFSDRIGWFRDMNQADDVRNAIEELTR